MRFARTFSRDDGRADACIAIGIGLTQLQKRASRPTYSNSRFELVKLARQGAFIFFRE